MTRREQGKALIEKVSVHRLEADNYRVVQVDALLDALCALPCEHQAGNLATIGHVCQCSHPTPRREGLDILMQGYYNESGQIMSYKLFMKWQEKFMAWATGRTELRWCEHIKYEPPPNGNCWSFGILQADQWQFCPICAAPRPEPR